MQQANVTCIRVYVDVKGLALMQVTFAWMHGVPN